MIGSSLTIAAVSLEYAEVVAAMHQCCFEDRWDERAVSSLIEMPGAFGFIAIVSSNPAAFILCRTGGGECEILTVGVLPECRSRGTGTKLLKSACAEAKRRGALKVFLEVADTNQPARRLYENAGFSVVGRRPGYYVRAGGKEQTDALVLSRELSSS